MTVVYADELLLVDLLADYILLLLTARLTGVTARRWRLWLAAALGAVYALAAAVTDWTFLRSLPFKLLAGAAMTAIAFGGGERFWRMCLVFFGVSAGFAGAVMAAAALRGEPGDVAAWGNVSLVTLLAAFAVSWCAFTLAFRAVARRAVRRELAELTICLGDRKARVTALVDTGNGLRDPLTGGPVTVCGLGPLEPLFPPEVLRALGEERDPVEALARLEGTKPAFRLVPYRTVGAEGGLLPAFRPDALLRDGKAVPGALVAVTREGFGGGAGYGAVTDAP